MYYLTIICQLFVLYKTWFTLDISVTGLGHVTYRRWFNPPHVLQVQ